MQPTNSSSSTSSKPFQPRLSRNRRAGESRRELRSRRIAAGPRVLLVIGRKRIEARFIIYAGGRFGSRSIGTFRRRSRPTTMSRTSSTQGVHRAELAAERASSRITSMQRGRGLDAGPARCRRGKQHDLLQPVHDGGDTWSAGIEISGQCAACTHQRRGKMAHAVTRTRLRTRCRPDGNVYVASATA